MFDYKQRYPQDKTQFDTNYMIAFMKCPICKDKLRELKLGMKHTKALYCDCCRRIFKIK